MLHYEVADWTKLFSLHSVLRWFSGNNLSSVSD